MYMVLVNDYEYYVGGIDVSVVYCFLDLEEGGS